MLYKGPLLWHFENNSTNDLSVELDLEEVKILARQIGFELSVSTLAVPIHYHPIYFLLLPGSHSFFLATE